MSRSPVFLANSIALCSLLCSVGLAGCSSSTSRDGGQRLDGSAAGNDGSAAGGGSDGSNQDAAQAPVGSDGGVYPLPVDAGQTGFMTWSHNGQPVGFYLPPPTGKPLPVVVFLHGCNNNPISSKWWIIAALNKVEPCAVLLPFRPAGESPTCSAWGGTYDDDLRPGMVDALAGLDSVIAQFGLDSKRQYLYGESMGAEGTLELLVRFPTRFAGAVVVGGYTLDVGAEQMAQTPLWLIHGSADTTNPPGTIETIYQSILNVGGTLVKLTEYQGMEHTPAIVKARSEPGLLDWLLAQRHDGVLRTPVGPSADGGEPDSGITEASSVAIQVTGISSAYEGSSLSLALLTGAADCTAATAAPAYAARGVVTAGTCQVSIPLVPAGTYTACAFIDADGNLQPSPGDLVSQQSLVVSGDVNQTWSTAGWIAM